MNRTLLALILIILTLRLSGIKTNVILSLVLATLFIIASVQWLTQKQFPKQTIKVALYILIAPILLYITGTVFTSTLAMLSPADALLLLLVAIAILYYGPRLLK